ncbi:MAG: histidine kinase dimerization/phosphoacceptor domain -containing protein [Candidatus Omnitrophota bacterium]|nr:histidine kinase dimerization/phosphoacceptor domain -containing protein [Candidatus Omnitrophota bacterium]
MPADSAITILLVDDRPENLLALEATLRDPRYRLVRARSGAEALEQLSKQEAALILLDVQMPQMDGFETARRIKRTPQHRDIPIIFITAINKDPVHVFQGYDSGAIDYLMKPFDDHVLRSKVAVIAELFEKNLQVRQHQRELMQANAELQKEIWERQHAEQALRLAHVELERRVQERTAALAASNEALRLEIAERRRAEEALRVSEQLFRTMADAAPVMIWMSDTNKLCTYFNAGWLEFSGRRREQELGTGWTESLHLEDLDRCLTTYASAFDRHEPFKVEYRLRRADGEYRWILAHGVPLFDAGGAFQGYIGGCVDLTDHKQTEERVRASLREKEILLKEIHHRVRNNLQVISSLLDLQAGYIQDPQALAVFQSSQSRVKSMALVHKQLYQSRNLAQIDMAEYLQHLAEELDRSHGLSNNAVTIHVDGEEVLLGVDMAIPCALLVNELITNALEHAFEPGQSGEVQVTLSTTPDGQCVVVVRDMGKGFPPEIDFRHTDSLGLVLVNALTEQLHGLITLGVPPGTTFTIAFPLTKEIPLYAAAEGSHRGR